MPPKSNYVNLDSFKKRLFLFIFSQKVKPFIVSSESEITFQTNRKSSEESRIKNPLELLLLQKISNKIRSVHWRINVTERSGWKSKILSESSIRSQSVTIELSRLRPNFKVIFLPCLSIIKSKKLVNNFKVILRVFQLYN